MFHVINTIIKNINKLTKGNKYCKAATAVGGREERMNEMAETKGLRAHLEANM